MQQKQKSDGGFVTPSDDIVALYLEHVPVYMSDLLKAVNNDDREQIHFQCHKLSSVMKVMGFENLDNLLHKVHHDDLDAGQLSTLCNQLDQMVQHTLVLLQK